MIPVYEASAADGSNPYAYAPNAELEELLRSTQQYVEDRRFKHRGFDHAAYNQGRLAMKAEVGARATTAANSEIENNDEEVDVLSQS